MTDVVSNKVGDTDMSDAELIIFDLDDTILATTAWNTSMQAGLIKPFDGMAELLQCLRTPYEVVTAGDVFAQTQKVSQANLGFLQLHCCDPKDNAVEKLTVMDSLMESHRVNPWHTIVVGDKIAQEIMYGNLLGCKTIRTKFGGRHDVMTSNSVQSIPTFEMYSVAELRQMLKHWKLLKDQS